MTSLAIARRRLAARLTEYKVEAIAFAVVMLAGLAIGAVGFMAPAGAADDSVSIQLTPAKAAAMVAATSASPAEIRAIGEEARLINAALPFSTTPVQAARPFEIGGDDLDQRRALLCLTQAVYYEAGFEPLAGRRAVAQVVLNRMRHPAFPKSVCGVVYQGSRSPVCQFSFVCDGSLYRAPATGAWRDAKAVAEAALGGYVEKSVGASTHYHANYVAPRWAPMLTKITQLGAHIFYRWPGAWGQSAAFSGRYVGEPQDPLALRPPLRAPLQPGTPEQLAAIAEAEAGPPVARAPNDVGGLLDVSKGWTLNIPGPDEIGAATA
ncbi:MAG TPA: cell wall hydrolase, partial [Sphingomicrobium sp.]|nr:cell wall hydrolase [Sphingomicrobium sp.]